MPGEQREQRIRAHRDFFARLITANAGVADNESLRSAFASTPREHFLGPGPWKILARSGYIDTPSDDPAFVYQDAAIALDSEAKINNGQPSLHALCFNALNISEGETITHIGAGTGYYTAVLATLTGPQGFVHAFEIEAKLAQRAAENLADTTQVTVYERSGSEGSLPNSDVVYVCAGATGPQNAWLDALRIRGRLLFPLTGANYAGGLLLIKRASAETYDAKFLSAAMFIGCAGARDAATEERLTEAFSRSDLKSVQSLQRNSPPDDTCWFAGDHWWLSRSPAL